MKNYQAIIDSKNKIENTIDNLIFYLKKDKFHGWEPYDFPKFKLTKLLNFHPVHVVLTQLFRLSPIFLHPYFKEKKLHSKAVTLFAQAFLILYELTNKQEHRERALFFLNWLKRHRSPQSKNFSVGNQYQLSMKTYGANEWTPSPLITCFAIEAFISAYEIFKEKCFLELAESGIKYFLEELPQKTVTHDQWYFIYHPNSNQFIPNLPAVISGNLARFYAITKDQQLLTVIKNNLNYVVKFQREDGSWLYHPKSRYIDSFHTAFVLEALAKFQYYVGDNSFENALLKGLSYYEKSFFASNGRPIHKKLCGLPSNADSLLTQIDLRDCAMGFALFSFLLSHKKHLLDQALNLLNWSFDHFRSDEGYFYYQNVPIYTIKGPFLSMQAWMLYGLSKLQKALINFEPNNLSAKYE